jgi:hypothetical protein
MLLHLSLEKESRERLILLMDGQPNSTSLNLTRQQGTRYHRAASDLGKVLQTIHIIVHKKLNHSLTCKKRIVYRDWIGDAAFIKSS